MISRSRRDSMGGGVVAEFFRHRQEPTRFSGGGGRGSSRIFLFSVISKSLRGSVGGGVVAPFSRDLQLRNIIFTHIRG